jgi:type IV pilus assembly protein PilE
MAIDNMFKQKYGARSAGCFYQSYREERSVEKPKGFSLVEMLITIALIGIISTIAVYSWQRYVTNNNLRSAARDVAADIVLFKQRAVSESRPYQITFNGGTNNYDIQQWNAGTGTFDIIQTKTCSALGSDVSILNTTFVGDQVAFLPRGILSGLGGRVRLTNSRNSVAQIIVNTTGKTHVECAMQ